jgi:NAD-dependent deacetylase
MDSESARRLGALLADAVAADGPLVFLTGAGISAESGIPTFRGKEGYWRVGSRNYQPMELATFEAFSADPHLVWSWYLYRRAVCRKAAPNPAHLALVEAEGRLGDRFLLVTQNVDGLHLRAGNSEARTYQIHGNIDFMRCAAECGWGPMPVPVGPFDDWGKDRILEAAEAGPLCCAACGGLARPHLLWFDEYYDEARYRFESGLRAAHEAACLVVIGTSGATNLPIQMGSVAARRGIPLLVIGPEKSPFSEWAEQSARGQYLAGTAGAYLPEVQAGIARLLSGSDGA